MLLSHFQAGLTSKLLLCLVFFFIVIKKHKENATNCLCTSQALTERMKFQSQVAESLQIFDFLLIVSLLYMERLWKWVCSLVTRC